MDILGDTDMKEEIVLMELRKYDGDVNKTINSLLQN